MENETNTTTANEETLGAVLAAGVLAETAEQEEANTRRSVVAGTYKQRYAARAAEARGKKGVDKRVLKDCSGDWLALEMAALIRPTKKAPADLDLFERICRLNGVDLSKLPRDTKGWQGRFRMNGSQMLRTKVAEAEGELLLPDGAKLQAPKTWVAKHSGK